MYKLTIIIYIIFIINNNFVYSCSSKSQPKCEEKKYKDYEERSDIISKIPSSRKLNRLSLIGTHQSLSYLSGSSENKTQELDILFQLKHGVRVIEMTIKKNENTFSVFSGSMYLPQIFYDTLAKIDKFLEHHPREFIILILILHYDLLDGNNNINEDEDNYNYTYCQYIEQFIGSNDNTGWRITKNWSLDGSVGLYRGKILLATTSTALVNCAVNLWDTCKFENYIPADNVEDPVEEKWQHVVNFQEKSYLGGHDCFIYLLTIGNVGKHSIRANSKYGGYYVDIKNNICVDPINSRMSDFYYTTNRALFILIVSFPTQELIDRVNDCNSPNLKSLYYWEGVKKKLYTENKL